MTPGPHGASAARLAVAAVLAAATLAAPAARADLTVEAAPAVSAGWTDNAMASGAGFPPQSDEFGTVSAMSRAHYLGKTSEHSLAYRLSITKYLQKHAQDAYSNEVSYLSMYNLLPTLDLTLGAAGTWSRTSAYIIRDQSAGTAPAFAGADLEYLTFMINQGLLYRPTARRRYIETISVSRMTYLSASAADKAAGTAELPPDTTYVNAHLRAEWERARDTFSLDGSLTDSYTDIPIQRDTIGNHLLFAQGLAGYHRDFSEVWSADVAAGGVLVLTTSLAGIAAPAAVVNVGYRRLFWFATASLSQSAAPNIYLGNATINDQGMIRAALPLTRAELLVLSGNAGYTYARFASQGRQEKAYSLWTAGVSLSWHAERLPFWGSLDYGYSNQDGSISAESGLIPSLTRNVVMATIGGSFMFGKGTPPIIGGALLPSLSGLTGAGSSSDSGGSSGKK